MNPAKLVIKSGGLPVKHPCNFASGVFDEKDRREKITVSEANLCLHREAAEQLFLSREW
jgi:hypothetical protein